MATTNSDGSIVLKTKVDTSGIDKGVKGIKGSVKSLNSSFLKLGAAISAAFTTLALIKFGKKAIDLASDLAEVQNVVDTAFGEMSYKIEEFASTAIEKFGISELTAKRTASTYMAMAQGLGIAASEGSDMAIMLTGLSADMSSFYNVSQEVADTALKGVFSGETESLKQFGIVMTEVNLQQFAYSKGVTKSLSAMTQQEKTLLRYNFILEQTKLAQGDFQKTSDGWANQIRVIGEEWKAVQAEFGEAFITLGTLVLPAIKNVINNMAILADLSKTAANNLYQIFTGKSLENTEKEEKTVKKTAENQKQVTEELKETVKESKKALAGFDELNVLSGDSANKKGGAQGSDMGSLGVAPVEISSGLDEAVTKISETMQTIMKIVSVSLAAVGVILLLTGHFALGVGFIIAGAAAFAVAAAAVSEGNLEVYKEQLSEMMLFLSTVLLAIGIILLLASGPSVLSIGLIIAGAAGLAADVALNWGAITEALRGEVGVITAIVSGALLALGVILVCCGVLPLGIGLIAAGAVGLGTTIALNWDAIVDKVTSIGAKIKKAFLAVWEGIKKGFKVMVNGIIGFANKWIDGLNKLLLPIRGIIYGVAKAFGSKIKFDNIKIPHIPKLAEGAVLPGGKPFLAMLGDQPSGKTNIEAPEELIRKIVREESGNRDITLTATGSMAQLIKMLNIEITEEKKRVSAWG